MSVNSKKVVEKIIKGLALSSREEEVAMWLASGSSNEEIATVLGISVNTVKFHVKNIYNKLGICNRTTFIFKINEKVVQKLQGGGTSGHSRPEVYQANRT